MELARAQIAWQLGKRYAQDSELELGRGGRRRRATTSRSRAPRAPRSRHRERRAADGSGAENDLRMIWETVVTTRSSGGRVHVAPMGIRESAEGRVVLAPFRPSTTLENVLATRVRRRELHRRRAGHRRLPDRPARLADAWPASASSASASTAHSPIASSRWRGSTRTASARACTATSSSPANHRPFRGFNRAQAAVVEAAILVSRLHMLPPEKIDTEMKYLAIAIEKTAGPTEREAWSWLVERIDAVPRRSGTR